MAEMNYYDILGVSNTATQDDIKRAYRRHARKLHPDLHSPSQKIEMEEKFKQLNEAYEVLKNSETRKKYDQYGKNWKEAEAYEQARQQAGGEQREWYSDFSTGDSSHFQDIFEQMFGRQQTRASGAAFRGFAMAGADLEASVTLSLREILTGANRRFTIEEPIECSTCHGKGEIGKYPCHVCHGKGMTAKPHTIEIRIPAGVRHGERLKVKGKGAPGRLGGPRGDLHLLINVRPDGMFRREKQDVIIDLPVWPWEAALGTTVEVPTLDGPVKLRIPPGSNSGNKLRLQGKGLPDRSGKRGDQHVLVKIVIPSSLTGEEKQLYEQLGKMAHSNPREPLLRKSEHG